MNVSFQRLMALAMGVLLASLAGCGGCDAGGNTSGEAANGAEDDVEVRSAASTGGNSGGLGFVSFGTGSEHTAAITAAGNVWTQGVGGNGQLCRPPDGTEFDQTRVGSIAAAVYASAGGCTTVVVLADGRVVECGCNHGSGTDGEQATDVGLSDVTTVAVGADHVLALLTDGTVRSWGHNEVGQLGIGNYADQAMPVVVPGVESVSAIAAGSSFSMALLSDGRVLTWGFNSRGTLGNPTVAIDPMLSGVALEAGVRFDSPVPVEVAGVTDAIAIGAGVNHALAVLEGGDVVGWGRDEANALAQGGAGDVFREAVPVGGISGVVAVDAGSYYSLARKSDGTVWSWGTSTFPFGDRGSANTGPARVPGLGGIAHIVVGSDHAFAIEESGSAWCWGNNYRNQCGSDEADDQPLEPKRVRPLA